MRKSRDMRQLNFLSRENPGVAPCRTSGQHAHMRNSHNLQFNNTFSTLGDAFFSQVQPAALTDPYLVSAN